MLQTAMNRAATGAARFAVAPTRSALARISGTTGIGRASTAPAPFWGAMTAYRTQYTGGYSGGFQSISGDMNIPTLANDIPKGDGVKQDKTVSGFGRNVMGWGELRDRVSRPVFREFQKIYNGDSTLTPAVADAIAVAMKDWALEKGATHYCHWFQPLSGETAEKHDSFLTAAPNGRAVLEFSGKELCQGETDASSLPNAGLRGTFEARGYTVWDCTSPVFVKQDGNNRTLFIPSAFCSFTGHALDAKTPLLRSMNAINDAAIRVLRAFRVSKDVNRVIATMGAEQEYFLVDKRMFDQRLDLALTGRTMFGAPSPKGQDLQDHYYGHLHERVASYMHELNHELWALGVYARTQHNEVAPGQYEIAPIFTNINLACDQNAVIMETLEKVAMRHNFASIMHEKPFTGINGSGKHCNWSLSTETGINLLNPGSTPHENALFLVFLSAIIRAVDKYAPLLRASAADAGNDIRLGSSEAPPPIISIFLGQQLEEVMASLADKGKRCSITKESIKDMELGVSQLPRLPLDSTDRNRTSPIAFTGDKFEFRMPGASASIAHPCMVINTIVADVLSEFATELEKCKTIQEVMDSAQQLCHEVAVEHSRVIYGGSNYSDDWRQEALKRGLPNLDSTAKALHTLMSQDNLDLFERQNVLSAVELEARTHILYTNHVNTVLIEAQTCLKMAKTLILPSVMKTTGELAKSVGALQAVGSKSKVIEAQLGQMTRLVDELAGTVDALEVSTAEITAMKGKGDSLSDLRVLADKVEELLLPGMAKVRVAADALEVIMDDRDYPLPSYSALLYSVSMRKI